MASAADAESVLVYLNTAALLRADPRTQASVPMSAATVADVSRSGVLPRCGRARGRERGSDTQQGGGRLTACEAK